jgi:SAM-dependent methyltransferase
LDRSWSIEAVDVKEEQVADCNAFFRKLGRENVLFEVADLTQYRKEDNFDFILSVDVMEHIEQDEQVFRNFFDSLTQEGILLISTPSDQGGSDVHDHDGESSFIEEHVRDGYGIPEITEKLKRAGFSKVEARYSYGRPGQVAWRLSMKYPILMLGASKIFFLVLPFYYLLTFPVSYLCNYIDVRNSHATGTGLIVKAWK